MKRRLISFLLALLAIALPAHAHVGNKDVYQQITAGPYKLFVTIRTPNVIPGVAIIEVRSVGASVSTLTITPLPLTGEASRHPPTPDPMKRSADDPSFYTGSLWLMGQGSWQVRFGITGAAGNTEASVPVPAIPTALLTMQQPLGTVLGALGLILMLGVVGIVYAAVRESRLTPGITPDGPHRRRAALAGGVALLFAIAAVALGGWWWNVETADYAAEMHHNSRLDPVLSGDTLRLTMSDPDLTKPNHRRLVDNQDDLLLDHGHLMHLYAIRMPGMDAVYHLHPAPDGTKTLVTTLPPMPPGTYKLFADVVFSNGFPETETATINIPAGLPSVPLSAEDASAAPPPLSAGELGSRYKLSDGYTMVFDPPATVMANTGYTLRFQLLDPSGKPAQNMLPYLGMAGHAAFVKDDFSTFAHTHPEGSAAMPAVMLAEASTDAAMGDATKAGSNPNAGMAMSSDPVTSTVEFPYGFPAPGRYRIFIQMKHGIAGTTVPNAGTVETGVFDVEVH